MTGNGTNINFGTVAGSLLVLTTIAAVGVGITAYAADNTAKEAKQTAELAESVNHVQDLRIQAVELEQLYIKETVDSNARKLDAIIQAMNIPVPAGV